MNTPTIKHNRPWRRWVGRGLATALLLVLTLIAGLITVLSSERASQFLLAQADQRLDQFSYTEGSGSVTDGLNIQGLHIDLGELQIRIAELTSRWQFWELLRGRFSIDQLTVRDLEIDLPPASTEPSPAPPWPRIASPLPLAVNGLDLQSLVIRQPGADPQRIERIELDARINPLGLRIKSLRLHRQALQLRLQGHVAATLPYKLRLDLDWQYQLEQQNYTGQATLAGDLDTLNVSHQLSSPYPLRTEGQVTLAYQPDSTALTADSVTLALTNRWPEMAIAVAEHDLVTQGSLEVQGGFDRYQLVLNTRVAQEGNRGGQPDDMISKALASPLTLSVTVEGAKLAARLVESQMATHLGLVQLSGEVDANGLLDGAAPLRWNAQARLQDIDLATVAAQWPAKFSADIASQGHWQGPAEQREMDYDIDVELANLSGQLHDKAINGALRANLTPQAQRLEALEVKLGDNALTASGSRTDKLNLQWQLNAPRLADVYPGLRGQIRSEGKAAGTLETPTIEGSAKGKRLAFNDYLIDALNVKAALNHSELAITAEAEGITAAVLNNAQLTLSAKGTQQQHRLDATLTNGLEKVELGLAGGLMANQAKQSGWRGLIDRLTLNSPSAGNWSLSQPASLQAGADLTQLKSLCLVQAQASICSELKLAKEQITARLDARDIAIENFLQGMPSGSGISGRFNLNANADGPITAPKSQLSANVDQFVLRYKPEEEEPAIEFPAEFTLQADSNGKQAKMQSRFTLGEFGRFEARASASSLDANGQLEGRIDSQFSNLQWLGAILPQLEKLDGQLSSQVALGGTLTQPTAQGDLNLTQLKMDVPDIGLQLRNGDVALAMDAQSQWRLNARVDSKDSQLEMDGSGSLLGSNGPEGRIAIKGDKFLLANTEEFRLITSPAVEVTLAAQSIDIGGKVSIDDGHYVLQSLPSSAVTVSADEKIVSRSAEASTSGRPLNIDVALSINKQFKLEGFGLTTKLGGKLRLRQQGDGSPQGYGSLNLYEGLYKAYGQKLAVESGVLIFQGPLDNPGLNITAVREAKDATVGIRIGGYAQDIRSELFSDPAMSPTDTMAILITGKAPSQMNQDDANQVMNAATALGISQSAGISNALKETFGLDVVSLQGGETYTESSLVVGKYLSPKLFISYVQNLFTPAGAVQLEYSLTDNLGLKAESGKEQSIDWLYKVEHGK